MSKSSESKGCVCWEDLWIIFVTMYILSWLMAVLWMSVITFIHAVEVVVSVFGGIIFFLTSWWCKFFMFWINILLLEVFPFLWFLIILLFFLWSFFWTSSLLISLFSVISNLHVLFVIFLFIIDVILFSFKFICILLLFFLIIVTCSVFLQFLVILLLLLFVTFIFIFVLLTLCGVFLFLSF